MNKATVIEVASITQARIVLAKNSIKTFTKLIWATTIAEFLLERRPAIEKKSGDMADDPRPARKKPRKAIVIANCRLKSIKSVELIIKRVKLNPPTIPPSLSQKLSL